MCGRYVVAILAPDFEDLLELSAPDELPARYNVAPSQDVLTVSLANGARRLSSRRWGLLPSWAKDPAIANKLINARGETIAEKPSFRSAFKRGRCLIPMSGFYEWKRGSTPKQPYFIHTQDPAFCVAGLSETWTGPDGPVETCTIITTAANAVVAPLHDRMPVILPSSSFDAWLDPKLTTIEQLGPLLVPYPPDQTVAYPVSRRVSSPSAQGADLIEPVPG